MRSTSMRLYDNVWNSESITSFDLSAMKLLTSIIIGNNNMYYTNTFILDNMLFLESVSIGSNSFTSMNNRFGNDSNKSFHILNCDKLESISIGKYSFSDYGGEFELSNLPQLQSIVIGQLNSNSYNFYSSSLIIQSI